MVKTELDIYEFLQRNPDKIKDYVKYIEENLRLRAKFAWEQGISLEEFEVNHRKQGEEILKLIREDGEKKH